ncbi:SUF system Fe-S cluster assembly regulator [Cupriavidus basilensis]|uniref:SUF system Fe-S cluster assembly regulator n=1 Tax=Cupriavidus basilensis TaxID=68895 RepID=A0ABT6APD0_9BURK|nr:SUF system Fe-S cluster assembly regulator [Cupriavidus basilensis]MDF3834253.1 SUF system Fe-S cluster assembly regulator [Cupriavidus basilensis]
MLRLSKLTDYGTVIMTHMARDPGRIHSAAEIAAEIGVAVPTASKILKMLARQDLLHSLRGAKGGYLLARAPRDISIAQVIDAMEGPAGLTECSIAAGLCAQEDSCAIRANWQRISLAIFHALDGVTLADMTQPTCHPVDIGMLHAWKAAGRKQAFE